MSDGVELEELVNLRLTRRRWVLILGATQLAVLGAGAASSFATGFFAFLALGAAWMFLATRIARGVIGDRALDQSIGQEVRRRVLSQGLHGEVPADIADDLRSLVPFRKGIPALSIAMAIVLGSGMIAMGLPAAGPWVFAVAAVVGIGGLGWAWSKRKAWGRARARVDAWADVAQPLEAKEEEPPKEAKKPRFEVIEGGRE